MSNSEREFALTHAKAVIEALRDPTDEMIQAVQKCGITCGNDASVIFGWQTMIDMALKE